MLGLDLRDDTPGVPVRRCSCGATLCTPEPCPQCSRSVRLSKASERAYAPVVDTLRRHGPLTSRKLALELGIRQKATRDRLLRMSLHDLVTYSPDSRTWHATGVTIATTRRTP